MQPPEGLFEKIVARVAIERERSLRRKRRFTLAFLTFTAFGACIPLTISLIQQMQESGFFTYTSFVLSDTQIVLAHWQGYVAGLVETAPLLPLTGLLSVLFIFLVSLRSAMHDSPQFSYVH